MKEYLQINTGSAPTGVVWDSLKAFLRGLLIQQVARIKREGREREGKLGLEVAQAEARFIEEPTPTRQKEWLGKQLEHKTVNMRKLESKRILQRQCQFGEGEKVGRMLLLLCRTNSPPSNVPAIRTAGGEISTNGQAVINTFCEYYKTLYKSKKGARRGDMEDFFQAITVPTLPAKDMQDLEAPITLEEIKQAVAGMPNQKTPGPDGLPIEVYKRYGEVLLPELLRTLEGAVSGGHSLAQCQKRP